VVCSSAHLPQELRKLSPNPHLLNPLERSPRVFRSVSPAAPEQQINFKVFKLLYQFGLPSHERHVHMALRRTTGRHQRPVTKDGLMVAMKR
jgi:hypothetical protein